MLAPNEHLTGSPAQRSELRAQLVACRTETDPTVDHPELMFMPLPGVLDNHNGAATFRLGHAIMCDRFGALGLRDFLPLDRVMVGVRSTDPGAFGGFHYPRQGYRHLPMTSVVTAYGPLDGSAPNSPDVATLDLLRAYVHDCMHWGTYRCYALWSGAVGRPQHGINLRRADGRTYSARDPKGAASTRNLGVIMEGASDREARAITRETNERTGHYRLARAVDYWALHDVTGALTPEDLTILEDPAARGALAAGRGADTYLSNMAAYGRLLDRYPVFLKEVGEGEADDLHTHIVRAMLTGSIDALCRWLDTRHGPNTFRALFRTSDY